MGRRRHLRRHFSACQRQRKGHGLMDGRAVTAEVVTAGVTADVTVEEEGFVSMSCYRRSRTTRDDKETTRETHQAACLFRLRV